MSLTHPLPRPKPPNHDFRQVQSYDIPVTHPNFGGKKKRRIVMVRPCSRCCRLLLYLNPQSKSLADGLQGVNGRGDPATLNQ